MSAQAVHCRSLNQTPNITLARVGRLSSSRLKARSEQKLTVNFSRLEQNITAAAAVDIKAMSSKMAHAQQAYAIAIMASHWTSLKPNQ